MAEVVQVTVTDLVRNFANACRILVPSLNLARIPWADDQQYDSWDRIAEALFESLVLEPCRFQTQGLALEIPPTTARYGFPPDGETCFVSMKVGLESDCRVVQLLSMERPFDHIEGVVNGDTVTVPLDGAKLRFVVLAAENSRHEIEVIDLDR